MNKILQDFARQYLKVKLERCDDNERLNFRRMYAPRDIPDMSIENVVDLMPADKLSWAMEQVQKTLERRKDDNA